MNAINPVHIRRTGKAIDANDANEAVDPVDVSDARRASGTRRSLIACMVGLGAMGALASGPASAQVSVRIGVAPPAPMVEVAPAPRAGYVWSPGYWRWNGRRHVWIAGGWLPARPGYAYAPAHWVQGPRGGWRLVPGGWAPAPRPVVIAPPPPPPHGCPPGWARHHRC